ncbi:beta-glucosidase BglX [Halomicrobium urmianum]|uniref:beta-glucosidase BglX n=1 Tax=Halomicrobium urmianum TaxID=1586233 RepID=UPI001CD96CCA|nr:beta-glucosidase BglX [Halomicrobium urmianum]
MTDMDTSDPPDGQTTENRIETLLDEMTLEEKVGQLNQLNGSDQTGPAVEDVDLEAEIRAGRVGSVLNADGLAARRRYQRLAAEESRLGIPLLFGFDVVHGYRTIFPIPLGEAATWNPDLVESAADVAASEAAAAGINWTFAPTADVTRDARWGRAMESNGEDPYLGARMTAARVRGFQGDDLAATDSVLACAKHFAGYGAVEAGREYNTVDVSESALRDVHLPPFEAAVDAGVGSVMNAFTVHDRIPAGASEHLVSDVLKGEWAFDGAVVSDWNSFRELIYHGVAADERDAARLAIEAGSDVDMVGHVFDAELAELVEDGVVDEALVDDAVRRVLRVKFRLGLFEDPYRYFDDEREASVALADEHRTAARAVARESTVLLENDGDLLPLDGDEDVAVVGALADSADDALGEWRARGDPADAVSVLDGLQSAVDGAVDYATGYEPFGDGDGQFGTVTDDRRTEAVEAVDDADVAVAVVGEHWQLSGECASRSEIGLPGDQRALLEALVATDTTVVAVLMNGRPLAIPWTAEHVPAILETWFLGTEAGTAVADVLLGESDPSGRLPMSFPRTVGQVPVHYDHLPTGRPAETAEDGWSTSYVDVPNDPLYAFGHGRSYASFEYADLELDADAIEPDETLTVSVTVENTSDVAGTEVVQLYTHDVVGSRSRPAKELTRFEKVDLEPGASRTVTFEIETDALAFWTADGEMAAEPGEFEVFVGRSAENVRLTDAFELVD